ncbi:MAG: hypothetical protein ACLRWA_05875 [Lachnospira sp.]
MPKDENLKCNARIFVLLPILLLTGSNNLLNLARDFATDDCNFRTHITNTQKSHAKSGHSGAKHLRRYKK